MAKRIGTVKKDGWMDSYVYVLPYALQTRGTITMHRMVGRSGGYRPPSCSRSRAAGTDPILVLREHMERIGGVPCKRCLPDETERLLDSIEGELKTIKDTVDVLASVRGA